MRKFVGWVKRHPVISGIGALILALVLYNVLVPSPPSYEYEVEAVSKGDVTRGISASGKLRALNTINVGSEVSGQVTAVYVDYNSPVTQGQPLAQIDDTRLRARVTQAQAQVQLARASLAQAEAAIARARTDVEVQSRDFARRKELAEKGFVSKTQLDQAQNLLATAKASLATGQAQAQSARAQIAQSAAELSSAQLDLSRTRILAPTSGVVINKLVEPGSTVTAGFQTPNLFEIAADTSKMQVEASVDEADIGQVEIGQAVTFTVDSFPDEKFAAKVQQIRKSATEAQNAVSYLVILDVDNIGGKLLTGMTANVEIITGRKKDATRVPVAATRFRPKQEDRPEEGDEAKSKSGDNDKTTVWLTTDDPYRPEEVEVQTGLEGEDYVEITNGLKPGQKILLRTRNLDGSEDNDRGEDD
ncbi:efflux RND transporter periplasmic adaptor subunit [Sphingorhabdus sp. Alg239-R122]|uniref:efflux RND transporter periplasmic adaptor subunit n=1 Tax=Sphingorhabdus sp. Alg239-R122 TaxID=2305989 RepID=UPI0013DBFA29|nr:efflux RND transporter periplasmic adaptor subunit [Sphingorhabdus sp. Alg239-R122]